MIILDDQTDCETATARLLLSSLDEVPDAARVLNVTVEDGICTVDMSEEFYATEPESADAARLVMLSIVNTMSLLTGAGGVVVCVNGLELTGYGGYATSWPAVFDWESVDFLDEAAVFNK